jgi:hypothetical protein
MHFQSFVCHSKAPVPLHPGVYDADGYAKLWYGTPHCSAGRVCSAPTKLVCFMHCTKSLSPHLAVVEHIDDVVHCVTWLPAPNFAEPFVCVGRNMCVLFWA